MRVLAIIAVCLLLVSGQSIVKKLRGDNIREDVELFMQSFFTEAFGFQLPLLQCDHDAVKVQAVIKLAFEQIKDGVDFEGLVRAAVVVASNKDTLFSAFQDSEQTLIVLKDAALVCYPLTDPEVAVIAAKNAALHHPLAFTRNINRAKDAIKSGDYAAAGKYAG